MDINNKLMKMAASLGMMRMELRDMEQHIPNDLKKEYAEAVELLSHASGIINLLEILTNG